jgi:transcriptional regulator with GAF, ATPase, and Fis domain
VHDMSPRRDGPLVKVNCASVPRELFESEFFGHVRGAFSGALRDRQGRFALADGGTLFLDEVGEIPLTLQGKLLRVLQEGTFEPVGDDRTRHVNVRVIAATNRPLETDVEAGTFRRDLFYRLSVLPISVPPLRERRDDILPMARRFLQNTAQRLNLPPRPLSPEYERMLLAYDFPGNVRELQNMIERDLVLHHGDAHGPLRGLGGALEPPRAVSPKSASTLPSNGAPPDAANGAPVLTLAELRELEHKNFVRAFELSGFQISGPRGAARLLGMSPSTLSYRLKQLGITRPK